ncbi:MAG: Zn-ribbon domain-containing OB-fold protein [Hyphomicrobiaceae bacterium]|nr:MAG: Zn-ribbon domain-containing OB-fold protein [Hyphomicrobiaceae bacterium]
MSEKPTARPAPQANVYVDTAPFWEAAARRELVLQYCKDTGRFQHYPRPVSIYSGSRNIEWRKVAGKGTIYACTVIRIPGPGLEGRLPLAVATVELDEGVRMIANIVESDPADVAIGRRVELAWEKLERGYYPAFKLAKG